MVSTIYWSMSVEQNKDCVTIGNTFPFYFIHEYQAIHVNIMPGI